MDIVRKEIEAREISDSVESNDKRQEKNTNLRSNSQQGTTRSFVAKQTNVIQCYFCGRNHVSSNCDEIVDVQERKKILINSKRCFHCLKTGHISKSCPSTVNCRTCGGKYHHKAICLKGLKKDSVCEKNSEPREETEQTVTATTTGKGEVLLQTAEAYVYGEDLSKKLLVNVLFDSGSQRSYVTEEVKEKLKLNVERTEQLNLNTFGSEKSARKRCSLVNLNLEVGIDEPQLKSQR